MALTQKTFVSVRSIELSQYSGCLNSRSSGLVYLRCQGQLGEQAIECANSSEFGLINKSSADKVK